MPLKLAASLDTSSLLRRPGSLRPKSLSRPICSAATATAFNGASARPATSHEASSAAIKAGTAETTRKTTMPDRLDCGTLTDCPATT